MTDYKKFTTFTHESNMTATLFALETIQMADKYGIDRSAAIHHVTFLMQSISRHLRN